MRRRRRATSQGVVGPEPREAEKVVTLVSRLEGQRDALQSALSATPPGVTFAVIGSDYLPVDVVARQLADTEVLLATARHRLRHIGAAR